MYNRKHMNNVIQKQWRKQANRNTRTIENTNNVIQKQWQTGRREELSILICQQLHFSDPAKYNTNTSTIGYKYRYKRIQIQVQ